MFGLAQSKNRAAVEMAKFAVHSAAFGVPDGGLFAAEDQELSSEESPTRSLSVATIFRNLGVWLQQGRVWHGLCNFIIYRKNELLLFPNVNKHPATRC